MKSLTKTQKYLFNTLIALLPFVYLVAKYPSSSEAHATNHTGVYITIGSIAFLYLFGLVLYTIDSKNIVHEKTSSRMFLMCSIGACLYGFYCFPIMLEYATQKGQYLKQIGIWLSVFGIIMGNYQYNVKAGSAFNGIALHAYSPAIQRLNNRYQGIVSFTFGVIGLIIFNINTGENVFVYFLFSMSITTMLAFGLARYRGKKLEQ